MDDKDVAIVHYLELHPETLLKEIPEKLKEGGGPSIPYATIQKRVNRLTAKKVIDRDFSINWTKAGYLVRYRVGVLVDPTALRQSTSPAEKYNSQKGLADYIRKELAENKVFKNKLVVDDVHILLGGSVDLAIDFYSKDDKTATTFIIDALRNLHGIRDTVSAKLAYSSKHGWLSQNGDDGERNFEEDIEHKEEEEKKTPRRRRRQQVA